MADAFAEGHQKGGPKAPEGLRQEEAHDVGCSSCGYFKDAKGALGEAEVRCEGINELGPSTAHDPHLLGGRHDGSRVSGPINQTVQ